MSKHRIKSLNWSLKPFDINAIISNRMIFFCFLWWNIRNTLPQNRRWVSLCCSFLFVEVNCFSICAPGRFRRQNHLVRVRETSRFGLKYYFCSPQTRLEFSPALVFGLVWFWSTHIREEYLLVLAPNMAGRCPEVSQKNVPVLWQNKWQNALVSDVTLPNAFIWHSLHKCQYSA